MWWGLSQIFSKNWQTKFDFGHASVAIPICGFDSKFYCRWNCGEHMPGRLCFCNKCTHLPYYCFQRPLCCTLSYFNFSDFEHVYYIDLNMPFFVFFFSICDHNLKNSHLDVFNKTKTNDWDHKLITKCLLRFYIRSVIFLLSSILISI